MHDTVSSTLSGQHIVLITLSQLRESCPNCAGMRWSAGAARQQELSPRRRLEGFRCANNQHASPHLACHTLWASITGGLDDCVPIPRQSGSGRACMLPSIRARVQKQTYALSCMPQRQNMSALRHKNLPRAGDEGPSADLRIAGTEQRPRQARFQVRASLVKAALCSLACCLRRWARLCCVCCWAPKSATSHIERDHHIA